eukprot:CAMPEP_0119051016 /NCGR_PEP_ID=MMETSP1177-20130426/72770_1 /TAXON_ID=2985 /ORGANISM="Ochromonas sp, Strain CCMP1899" /LENGTH=453 /DNA_ID=CAMNT_0007030069 /DNA_START=94 /DNA_END=1455 /DNA_ORIENTATION=-
MDKIPLRWQVGFDTDIGGGRENQDDCFVWSSIKDGICVLCVLDGHGREVGKIAANAAKASLQEYFELNFIQLKETPYECLVKAHEVAHFAIKANFKVELEQQGFEVAESPEGYLLKRKGTQQWSCVHGGSACSICAIVDGLMYIANVGDSSGTLCCLESVLNKSHLTPVGDAAVPVDFKEIIAASTSKSEKTCVVESSNTIVVTAEHSPESPYEFLRLRDFRPREENPKHPSLNIVYDSPAHEKAQCPPVFSLGINDHPIVTNKGSYYKNVRKEWASLVSTPSSARFQDALAFTRSLGDLHLHTYGVTHLPEVQCINLNQVMSSLMMKSRGQETEKGTSSTSLSSSATDDGGNSPIKGAVVPLPMLCLVLATDGVWDNWTYEDVTKFVMDPSCLDAVAAGADGAHRVTLSFMQRNAVYSKRNFGGQADNATGIVMYLSPSVAFPASSDFDIIL